MMNTKDKLTDYEMLKKDYLKVTTQNAALLEALEKIKIKALRGNPSITELIAIAANAIRKAKGE